MSVPLKLQLSSRQKTMRTAFTAAGLPTAELDARVLMAALTGLSETDMVSCAERLLSSVETKKADEWQAARLAGKPVSRLIGHREFYGLTFSINEHVLDPRPDSEVLVDAVLQNLPPHGRLLDLGTGSGALLLTILAHAPGWQGVGVDMSASALGVARQNAKRLGLDTRSAFVCGHWGGALNAPFNVIVTNPPYIATHEIKDLSEEVRAHAPIMALDGGSNGLQAYADLLSDVARLLSADGVVYLEVGQNQAERVMPMMGAVGLVSAGLLTDLAGYKRGVIGRWE